MRVAVNRLSFLGIGSVKHDEMLDHYSRVIGLPITYQTASEVYLACGLGHHAIALHRDSSPGHRYVGLEISGAEPLEDALAALESAGVAAHLKSDIFPGVARAIEIRDPDGYSIYLHRNEGTFRTPYVQRGIEPDKLGHVAMFVESAKRSESFYVDFLDFRWSDWVDDYFVFLRCNADHHTMNFQTGKKRGLFHLAFELRDFSHIGRSCDILASNGTQVLWGPGRHGPGHNVFTYHRDPDRNIVEFYCDLDRMSNETLGYFDPRPYHQEFPQRPKVWSVHDRPAPPNLWGPLPPPGWRD